MISNKLQCIKPLNGFSKKLLIFLTLGALLIADSITLSGTVVSDNKKMITKIGRASCRERVSSRV